MQLDKFYVDVISAAGDGCIGYAARFDGFGLRATLATTLQWSGNSAAAAVQQRTGRGRLPTLNPSGLSWRCPALAIDGTWLTLEEPAAEHLLWSDMDGCLSWQVLVPRGTVELRTDQRTFRGLGYAERLRLNVAPWPLPINGLRWGRFVSGSHSIVWIEWDHATPRRWLWHNGTECAVTQLDEHEITWPGHRLALAAPRTLRTGRLADTVFARWTLAKRWLPARILGFAETKWCSAGALTGPSGSVTSGWVIHEIVRLRSSSCSENSSMP